MKRRSLVNSGRRRRRVTGRAKSSRVVRRRKNAGKKRMTAKQIKYFGTARQRAALRSHGTRKRRKNPYNVYTDGGFGKPRKFKRARAAKKFAKRIGSKAVKIKRRKNVGQIFSIGLAGLAGNPGKKRKRTAKRRVTTVARRRRRSNAGHRKTRARKVYVHRRRRRRTNAGGYRRRRRVMSRVTHRRRRNAGAISGALGSTTGMFKNAISVIGGAIGTRYATQLALGANNTGAIGYLANAIAALALGWAAGKFMKSPQVGAMVTLGGITGLALRMLSDLTPIGNYVNLSLQGAGKAGDTGIGLITDTTFYVPTVFNNGSMTSAMVPNQLTQLIAAGSVGSKSGVGSMRRMRRAA